MKLTVDSGQLPVGWEIKILGEICNISTGKLNANAAVENGQYPFFTCSREIFAIDHFTFDCEAILLAGNNAVGDFNVKHYKGKFNAYQRTYVITFKKENSILYKYLYLQLESALKYFKLKSVGAGTKFLKLDMIKNLRLHLPPLPEQKWIVAILDEAFEGIDRAIANTKKNLANSREIFESYLNALFTQKGDGWVEKKLGDIATFRNGLNFTKSSKGESIKIVGVKDFQNHFWIQEDQLDSVTIDAELKEIDILRKGDILTVRSNGNKELIGRCVLAGELSEKTSHSGFTIRIRIEREDIYPQFIVHYLKSRELRKQLTESGGGISISSFNQQGLSLIILSFPSLVEQKAIVANIDELVAETQRLETIYRQKIAALNELKQSILQKAFTGELTADTPKTVKEEIAA
ncbi:restriction endonuclease subunit S [Argonema antarcticum]|uniref:restriction endonuclease subunit S n=1 Tax=Argonema antarcticum TaxID=2942763 RepID=UPI0020130358|nr:restriction endonuclease subunit S [Argonema antarcticum]MCL1471787.1 restriction endonuclease subunit S [Argonema antarcticum A004/B2]